MTSPSPRPKTRKKKDNQPKVTTVVQLIVLFWCGVLLTLSWNDANKNRGHTTFLAGVFTAVLANFGIDSSRQKAEEDFNLRNSLPPSPPNP
jgi:hypothetical protein